VLDRNTYEVVLEANKDNEVMRWSFESVHSLLEGDESVEVVYMGN